MARAEWLRTFVAVYRAGSVTEGARRRGLSQPAASQQLASLARLAGAPLFVRTPGGVEATSRGHELYGQVADALDRLEGVLGDLDGGRLPPPAVVRVGCPAEYAALRVVPRLAGSVAPLRMRIGSPRELWDLLGRGELDVVCAPVAPGRRDVAVTPLAPEPFVLVAAPELAPPPAAAAPADVGAWLAGRPWVAVSVELPLTRRLWQEHLGRPFAGELRLAAPDRRVVAAAVVAGTGTSLLPRYVCEDALARGDVVEVLPVGELVPPEPWFAGRRATAAPDDPGAAVAAALAAPAAWSGQAPTVPAEPPDEVPAEPPAEVPAPGPL